ncbi:hypothetical protein GCM10010140_73000 [Streptosporangium pseudovulgare]|uniref:Transposase IS4-like domain-containing protein n=1 Tax=Streptosporangium pseudovulgare TaxID=35765 RepID=A0ABQ2RLZ9_9ACTN|nr:hypothetical protein GCM10010140_73000 [Streptosporangium pseudovulgare]
MTLRFCKALGFLAPNDPEVVVELGKNAGLLDFAQLRLDGHHVVRPEMWLNAGISRWTTEGSVISSSCDIFSTAPARLISSPSTSKGYDYRHLRQWLSGRGIRHRIARKGIESSHRLGRHRWTIERTMSWLAGCRRLHRRYERKAEHFLAFTSIACTLICYRRLNSPNEVTPAVRVVS